MCGVLVACALAQQEASSTAAAEDEAAQTVLVMSVTLGEPAAAAALGALAVAALAARGLRAVSVPAPAACAEPAAAACSHDVLRALVLARAHVAMLPVPAARPLPALRLRDAGLSELGDVAPAARLSCHVRSPVIPPSPRSLLDFADEAVAPQYYVPHDDIVAALRDADDTDHSGYVSHRAHTKL